MPITPPTVLTALTIHDFLKQIQTAHIQINDYFSGDPSDFATACPNLEFPCLILDTPQRILSRPREGQDLVTYNLTINLCLPISTFDQNSPKGLRPKIEAEAYAEEILQDVISKIYQLCEDSQYFQFNPATTFSSGTFPGPLNLIGYSATVSLSQLQSFCPDQSKFA